MQSLSDVHAGFFVIAGALTFAATIAWSRYNNGLLWPMSPLSGRAARGLPRTPAGAAASALYDAIRAVIAESNAAAAAAASIATTESKSPFARKPRAVKFLPPFDPRAVAKAVELLQQRSGDADAEAAVLLLRRAEKEFASLVESRRAKAFSEEEPSDVALLETLWAAAFNGGAYQRPSEKWSELGFQGLDPTTDLRGGGLLALDHFVAFARADSADLAAMMAFNKAQLDAKASSWFLTAVVSIQFSTQLALGEIELLPAHLAVILGDGGGVSRGLQRVHSALLKHFFEVWQSKKPFVMEYTQFVGPNVIDTFCRPDWTPKSDVWDSR